MHSCVVWFNSMCLHVSCRTLNGVNRTSFGVNRVHCLFLGALGGHGRGGRIARVARAARVRGPLVPVAVECRSAGADRWRAVGGRQLPCTCEAVVAAVRCYTQFGRCYTFYISETS